LVDTWNYCPAGQNCYGHLQGAKIGNCHTGAMPSLFDLADFQEANLPAAYCQPPVLDSVSTEPNLMHCRVIHWKKDPINENQCGIDRYAGVSYCQDESRPFCN